MGLLMKLPKEDNILYHDFENAYWCLEDIRFGTNGGQPITSFRFNAYPSRVAKEKRLFPIRATLTHGGATGIAYNPILHEYRGAYSTELIFPNGIPVDEKTQKDVLYDFIKTELDLANYTNVFE